MAVMFVFMFLVALSIIALLCFSLYEKHKAWKRKSLEIKTLTIVLVNSSSKEDVFNIAKNIYNIVD